MQKEIKILHIDTQKTWRGGQQQAFYLHQGLIAKNYTSIMICQPDSPMAKRCLEQKLPFQEIKMRNEADLIAASKISALIKKNQYNIIHCHSAHAQMLGIIIKLFFPKLILIGSRRVDFPIRSNFFSKFKYNSSLLNKIVCISQNIKNVMLSSKISPEKLHLIHSGINTHKFENLNPPIPSELNVIKEKKIVGTIAALTGHKDYPTLLKTAKILTEKRNDCVFIAVGDGKDKDEILELKNQLMLNDNFIFTGYKSNVADYLLHFDIFVLSSKLEGLGTSVLDAMAANIPVVACSSGGIPEMITPNFNGLLAQKENPADLAEKLEFALDHPDELAVMTKNAKISVEQFSIENTINKNIELYKSLL
jgi:glycosyltransferase involved in cell wall biosynthesis